MRSTPLAGEYYLTRAEQSLLKRYAPEIAQITRPEELIELGSGSSKKTRLLIEAGRAAGTLKRYLPVDVSHEIAERSARQLAEAYPGLQVHAVVGDFQRHLEHVPAEGQRLVAFLGSTIGNLDRVEAVALLGQVARLLGEDDAFLLGTDLVKAKVELEAAYNDSAGITAQFNRNILLVINEHLDGDFDPDAFAHVSTFNEDQERIETSLRSKRGQSVRLDAIDLEVRFEEGEEIQTEISCKYTRASVESMLRDAGLRLAHWYTDEDRRFALSLSRKTGTATETRRRGPRRV